MTRAPSTTGCCWASKGPWPKRAPFHPGPAARRAAVQGPPRRAHHAAAHRAGLRRRRARHPRPRHRHPGRAPAPARHLRGHRVGHRRASKRSAPPGCPSPGGTSKAPARARPTGSRCGTPPCCACCTTRATPARSPTAGAASSCCPAGNGRSITLPREEWISFIPGAHPGYITLDQCEANIARLAANAAAHGRDRAAGPPREGPALLQGIIICGRCGSRMTIRYHARGGKTCPPTSASATASSNARPICTAIPGHTLDAARRPAAHRHPHPAGRRGRPPGLRRTPAASRRADALRAAHVERARYHADLARRRYLAVDPANRLVAGTLEAGWNTALRALNDAQAAYDKAREQHAGQLTDAQKDPDRPARHRPARHLERPRHPDARAQAHRPAAAHRRHRRPAPATPSPRTSAWPAASTAPSPCQSPSQPGRSGRPRPATIAEIDQLLDHHTSAEIAAILRSRGLANGEGRPFTPTMVQRVIRTYQLRSRRQRLLDAGLHPAQPDGRAARRVHRHRQDLVPRRNCQRAAV